MVERSLRGMKIGANSLESDIGVALVDRREVTYECLDNKQRFVVTLAADAEAPTVWECRCGSEARLIGAQVDEEEKNQKPVRTHWDMLLERRSTKELQELLDERLALLREGKLYKRMR
ncbi:hypothetical protein JOD55_001243 [Arcanobacterium pluranimalium]|uniref:RNA polymerase-binding protein RbpA n=1 Tax=Arcanobacterium pluranimalium TaxID=108028 RepID=UPI00195C48D3|nr:RNA polymerase-binding protein RbpA [Arcanobacterium pluranimalium]MBM7825416.1 hypothetical protein [Arcanobacterium pluranimalium]